MWWEAERALLTPSWLMMAKRVLTNITPVAKGYHGWILARCEVYFTKWHRHLCVASHSQLLWIISLLVQCWLVWLVNFFCTTAFRINLPLWMKPSILLFRIQLDFCFANEDSRNWMFSIFIPKWTPTSSAVSLRNVSIIFLVPDSPVTWTL